MGGRPIFRIKEPTTERCTIQPTNAKDMGRWDKNTLSTRPDSPAMSKSASCDRTGQGFLQSTRVRERFVSPRLSFQWMCDVEAPASGCSPKRGSEVGGAVVFLAEG